MKTLLITLAALAPWAYLVLMALLHRRFPAIWAARRPVSDYGLGPARPYFWAAAGAGLVATLALAGALALAPPDFPRRLPSLGYLLLRALALVALIHYPTDGHGRATSSAGRWHYFWAIVQFTALTQLLALAPAVAHYLPPGPLPMLLTLLAPIGTGSLAGLVLALLLRPLRPYFAALERLFLLSCALYLSALALALG